MDAAFATAAFPSMTTAALTTTVEAGHPLAALMSAEIERRARAAAGDKTAMTPGERLRFVKTGKAR